MISREVINGREATVAYIGKNFEPVARGLETMIKVIYDNGDVVFAIPDRNIDKAGEYDESKHPRDDHGRWTATGGQADGQGRGTGAKGHGAAPETHARESYPGTAGSGDVKFLHTDGNTFHAAMQSATAASEFGAAVHVYAPSEYQRMQTYLTADGKAGFAVKGNDIVSVFKAPDSTTKGVAGAALKQAVAAGGQRLDAFDTVLPGMYSNSGFRAVARLPWNEEYKPPGWSHETFGEFNGGRPDVVFMVHDPAYGRPYRPGDGIRVTTYDEGTAVQEAELRRLRKQEQTMTENLREAVYAYLVKNNAAEIAALMAPDIAVRAAQSSEDIEKLTVKHKTTFKADPDEIKALTAAMKDNPDLQAVLRQAFAGVSVAKATRTLDFYRHGATALNSQNTSVDRVRGWNDISLTEEGRKEAQKLGEKVAKDPPDHLVSSDLKRAHQTADIVAKAISDASGKNFKVDEVSKWARPWNVGDFAGQPSKEAVPQLVQYAVERPDEPVPNGESFSEFCERFCTGLADAFDKYPGTLGLVSHHRNDRLLSAMAANDWDGTIDGKTFGKKGEGTAGHEQMEIPTAKLRTAGKMIKWVNPPEDYSKVWEDFDPDAETFDSAGSSDNAYEWAMKQLLTIEKLQPGVADVHATTALGNDRPPKKKRKAKDFLTTITETHPKIEEEEEAKADMVVAARDGNGVEKADELVDWDGSIKITKTDEEQQLVFGWASVSHIDGELVVDKQDDVITSEELEKAAYDFVLYCREQGDMHRRVGVGKLVESTVYTAEKSQKCGLFAFDVQTGDQLFGWWTGFRVADPGVWKRIKGGDLPEFSIGGRAVRVPMNG